MKNRVDSVPCAVVPVQLFQAEDRRRRRLSPESINSCGRDRARLVSAYSYAVGSSRGIEIENASATPSRCRCDRGARPTRSTTARRSRSRWSRRPRAAGGRRGTHRARRRVLDGYTYSRSCSRTPRGLRAWLPLYAYEDYLQAIDDGGTGVRARRARRLLRSQLRAALLRAARDLTATTSRPRASGSSSRSASATRCSIRPRRCSRASRRRNGASASRPGCARRARSPSRGSRQGLMWGEANDGNSFHAGGTRGNAGLFATARDDFRIAQAFGRALSSCRASSVSEATRARRRAGRQPRPRMVDRRARLRPHGGFTGTSVWVEGNDRISVLLTNRVHPCAAPIAMSRIRAEFHDWSSNRRAWPAASAALVRARFAAGVGGATPLPRDDLPGAHSAACRASSLRGHRSSPAASASSANRNSVSASSGSGSV